MSIVRWKNQLQWDNWINVYGGETLIMDIKNWIRSCDRELLKGSWHCGVNNEFVAVITHCG